MASSAFEAHLEKWWALCSEDQQQVLRDAAASDEMDEKTLALLSDTRCPLGPVGTRWEMQPDYSWSWSPDVREFILTQHSGQ